MKFVIDAPKMERKGQCGRCPLLECNPSTGGFFCAVTHAYDPNVEDCPLEEYHGVEWHPYPKEKPTDGTYLVCYTIAGETDMAFDDYRLGEFWDNGDRVFAWAEPPKPFEEEE